jgi:hypothetical protein
MTTESVSLPMPPETLVALKGSINKWGDILSGVGEDRGWTNCPLCLVFLKAGCVGCPVSTSTGRDSCRGSPYTAWSDYMDRTGSVLPWKVNNQRSFALAQAELNFLKSLLPAGSGV